MSAPSGADVAAVLAWLDACESYHDSYGLSGPYFPRREDGRHIPRPTNAASVVRGLLAEVERLRAKVQAAEEYATYWSGTTCMSALIGERWDGCGCPSCAARRWLATHAATHAPGAP